MYSPTLRLLVVLELLETYGSISGPEIARRLEIDPRTVRRYIVSLQDMGIPIAAERGPYGSYRLERGSRLPPLIFNDSEASAIILGLTVIRQISFPIDASAVEGAFAKTERLLPEKLLQYVNDLKELVRVHSPPFVSAAPLSRNELVLLLEQAVRKHKRTMLTYSSPSGETTVRPVDLYGLVLVGAQWYAAGYCHLRQGLRTFRLDRVQSFSTTEVDFDRPQEFDLLDYVLGSLKPVASSFEVEVVLKTSLERARGAFPSEVSLLEPIPEGVLYRFSTSRLDWLALSLLASDIPFSIRQPPELYAVFRSLAEKAARVALDA